MGSTVRIPPFSQFFSCFVTLNYTQVHIIYLPSSVSTKHIVGQLSAVDQIYFERSRQGPIRACRHRWNNTPTDQSWGTTGDYNENKTANKDSSFWFLKCCQFSRDNNGINTLILVPQSLIESMWNCRMIVKSTWDDKRGGWPVPCVWMMME